MLTPICTVLPYLERVVLHAVYSIYISFSQLMGMLLYTGVAMAMCIAHGSTVCIGIAMVCLCVYRICCLHASRCLCSWNSTCQQYGHMQYHVWLKTCMVCSVCDPFKGYTNIVCIWYGEKCPVCRGVFTLGGLFRGWFNGSRIYSKMKVALPNSTL